jgi:hypothetical protein
MVQELSPYNNVTLNINRLPCSYFSLFAKMVVLKVVHRLKIYQNTKLHGPTLSGTSFAFTSEV